MNEISEKLNKVVYEILTEKTEGVIRIFALIKRTDLENKWDLFFSADWIKENNLETDLIYMIEKLKNVFSDNLDFLSQIVILTPNEDFIQMIGNSIPENNLKNKEILNFKIKNFFTVETIYFIMCDFTNFIFKTKLESSVEEKVENDKIPF